MEDNFPDPLSFDSVRYRKPRNEHRSPGPAAYGLGTHRCLDSQWVQLQRAVNVRMVALYFTLEAVPPNDRLRVSPLPSREPNRKLTLRVVEQGRELPFGGR